MSETYPPINPNLTFSQVFWDYCYRLFGYDSPTIFAIDDAIEIASCGKRTPQ